MSFILDALKKSESDRQRQSGPALFEVRIAPPKSRFPLWAVAIAALLGVNVMVGGWLLLRHPSHPDEAPAPVEGAAAAPSPATAPAVPRTASGTTATPLASAAPLPSAVAPSPAPAPVPAAAAPASLQQGAGSATLSESSGGGELGPGAKGGPTLAGAANEASGPTGAAQSGTNPDDYAPATEPAHAPGLGGHVRVGTESGFILYQDAALVPGANIPPLRLDLHVYAPKPEDRFALINMHKVREGDSLPQGVRVESITTDGVVLSHNGMRFLLPRQ